MEWLELLGRCPSWHWRGAHHHAWLLWSTIRWQHMPAAVHRSHQRRRAAQISHRRRLHPARRLTLRTMLHARSMIRRLRHHGRRLERKIRRPHRSLLLLLLLWVTIEGEWRLCAIHPALLNHAIVEMGRLRPARMRSLRHLRLGRGATGSRGMGIRDAIHLGTRCTSCGPCPRMQRRDIRSNGHPGNPGLLLCVQACLGKVIHNSIVNTDPPCAP